jgi:hypothetical protein
VSVLDYASPGNFVVELHAKKGGDRIIIARVTPGRTFFETVQAVMGRASRRSGSLRSEDHLVIPCINFDLTREYGELTRTPISGTSSQITRALQRIAFRLDEEGAILESSALGYAIMNGEPPVGRKMICDGPFLVLLARRGLDLPYFAFWVENDELLIR